ncbi:CPBP family intramembrane glutamic endopeptidase [Pontibaca methylaminivorans]|uniref:CPBP family intramembrane glutamic endopeptidase n=1 Tax=Pontibaca methylaminivorans TaxID=515897 RepID=UPI002FD9A627
MRQDSPLRLRLVAEFLGLFVLTPFLVAVFLPPSAMLAVLFVVTAASMVLLHRTPGFRWRDLAAGWRRIEVWIVAAFSGVTVAAALAVVTLVAPEAFLGLYRLDPVTWLAVMVLYPFLSALPQEIVFRPLFFLRYGRILPAGRMVLVLNAAVFSLAHLLYWNWIVATMTFAGGLVFAWAYVERRSFPLAVVLHAAAGDILFTVGAGVFFYTGTVVRPF